MSCSKGQEQHQEEDGTKEQERQVPFVVEDMCEDEDLQDGGESFSGLTDRDVLEEVFERLGAYLERSERQLRN